MNNIKNRLGHVRASSQQHKTGSDLIGRKDLDENRLIKLLNEYWSKASFGYPIHEDVRIPSSVAEMLRTESQKNLNNVAVEENGTSVSMQELLRLSVMLHYRPDLLNEYERLLKQWERAQKESQGRPYRHDPLAEYERLFKLWERTQNKIRKQTFYYEKEIEYQKEVKDVQMKYQRDLELDEAEREKARIYSKATSSSPNRGGKETHKGSHADQEFGNRKHSQPNMTSSFQQGSYNNSRLPLDEDPNHFISIEHRKEEDSIMNSKFHTKRQSRDQANSDSFNQHQAAKTEQQVKQHFQTPDIMAQGQPGGGGSSSNMISIKQNNIVNMLTKRQMTNDSIRHADSTIDLPNQSNDLVEDFQGFVAERMNDPMIGITEVYTVMTPTTERERRDKMINIKLQHRNTLRDARLSKYNSGKNRASIYKKSETQAVKDLPITARNNRNTLKKTNRLGQGNIKPASNFTSRMTTPAASGTHKGTMFSNVLANIQQQEIRKTTQMQKAKTHLLTASGMENKVREAVRSHTLKNLSPFKRDTTTTAKRDVSVAAITETQSDLNLSPDKSPNFHKEKTMIPKIEFGRMQKSPTHELLRPQTERLLEPHSSALSPGGLAHHQYNSLSRLKDTDEGGLANAMNYQLKYKQMGRPTRKFVPVVEINKDGKLETKEVQMIGHKYGFNQPLDKYFKDEKLKKLIHDTRQEQQRYKQISKLKPTITERTFEEFYRQIKSKKIKPIVERERRLFENRAKKFDKLQSSITKKHGMANTSRPLRNVSDKNFLNGTRTVSRDSKTFNQVKNYENEADAQYQKKRNGELRSIEERTQQIFSSCSKYLDNRYSKQSMHRDIEQLEDWLTFVKQVFRGDKAPPIVLRSEEGFQEEQHAIYQMRAKHEDNYYGKTVEYPQKKKKGSKQRKSFQPDEPDNQLPIKMFDGYNKNMELSNQCRNSQTYLTQESKTAETVRQRYNAQALQERPQTSEDYYVQGRRKNSRKTKPLMTTLTPAQVSEQYPVVFDEWQLQKQMAEGVKIGSRLKEDIKIVKRAHEKESWAGIAKMNIESLDPNSAFKSYRQNKLSTRESGTYSPVFRERDNMRKQIAKEIEKDILAHQEHQREEASKEEKKLQDRYYNGEPLDKQYAVPPLFDRHVESANDHRF